MSFRLWLTGSLRIFPTEIANSPGCCKTRSGETPRQSWLQMSARLITISTKLWVPSAMQIGPKALKTSQGSMKIQKTPWSGSTRRKLIGSKINSPKNRAEAWLVGQEASGSSKRKRLSRLRMRKRSRLMKTSCFRKRRRSRRKLTSRGRKLNRKKIWRRMRSKSY